MALILRLAQSPQLAGAQVVLKTLRLGIVVVLAAVHAERLVQVDQGLQIKDMLEEVRRLAPVGVVVVAQDKLVKAHQGQIAEPQVLAVTAWHRQLLAHPLLALAAAEAAVVIPMAQTEGLVVLEVVGQALVAGQLIPDQQTQAVAVAAQPLT
jgi:hypothetical protein